MTSKFLHWSRIMTARRRWMRARTRLWVERSTMLKLVNERVLEGFTKGVIAILMMYI